MPAMLQFICALGCAQAVCPDQAHAMLLRPFARFTRIRRSGGGGSDISRYVASSAVVEWNRISDGEFCQAGKARCEPRGAFVTDSREAQMLHHSLKPMGRDDVEE